MAKDEQHRREMGARIKELRAIHGFKQQFIAEKVNVDKRAYQMWQAGDAEPNQEHLEALAELFGVTPTFILRGETPDPLASRSDQLDRIEKTIKQLDEKLSAFLIEAAAADVEAQTPPAARQPPQRDTRRQRRP